MTMTNRSLSAVLAITTVFMLSACQPANQDVVMNEDVTGTVDNSHTSHDMADGMRTNATSTTEIFKEYNNAMTQMHDNMMVSAAYNDPDSAFAQGMLGHHVGAVAMSNIQLKYGTDSQMRKLAESIITSQQIEMAQMQSWLDTHPDVGAPMKDTQAMQQAYEDSMNSMHGEMMLGTNNSNPDIAFARGMLPHHKGAVEMAMVQLQFGKDPEMRALAQQIISVQELEMTQMQNWLNKNTR